MKCRFFFHQYPVLSFQIKAYIHYFFYFQGSLKIKLFVVFSTVHLQKGTFSAFCIKLHLKLLHKNDLKTTQDLQKQPPGGVLKKGVRKNFAKLARQQLVGVSFLITLQETPSHVFSHEFCQILNIYFVNCKRLTYSAFGKIDFLQYFTFSSPSPPIFNLGFDFSDVLAEQEKFAKPTLTTLS